MKASVIIGSFDPVDLSDLQEPDLPRALDDQTLSPSRLILSFQDALLGTCQCTIKTVIVEGLQQIVERPGFKRAQRILVVSGHKNQGWRYIWTEQFQYIEAVVLRHLYIEEN